MTDDHRRYADPELEAMEELGAIERRHRQMAHKLGIHHHALRAIWIVIGLALVGVAIVAWLTMR